MCHPLFCGPALAAPCLLQGELRAAWKGRQSKGSWTQSGVGSSHARPRRASLPGYTVCRAALATGLGQARLLSMPQFTGPPALCGPVRPGALAAFWGRMPSLAELQGKDFWMLSSSDVHNSSEWALPWHEFPEGLMGPS